MKQLSFYNKLYEVIDKNASRSDPEKLANSLYFFIKQHPENAKIDDELIKTLKKVKNRLSKRHKWSMIDIHKFFTILHNFTRYMKKYS